MRLCLRAVAPFTPFSVARADQQRAFYEAQGVRAFGAHAVPWRLSTGWSMARAVAAAGEALLATHARLKVVELGAGTGRLGFHVAVTLAARQRPVRVVLTEAAAGMVTEWRRHPQLAPLLEDGLLEVAVVDAGDPAALAPVLETHTGEALLVVGTYLFDTLPHELVELGRGTVRRGGTDEAGGLVFVDTPELALPRGVAPPADAEGRRCFVPVGALGAVAALEAARPEPAWLLVADKGPLRWDEAWEDEALRLVEHGGAWSVAVNFPLLRQALAPRPWLELGGNAVDFSVHAIGLRGAGGAEAEALERALADVEHPLVALRRTVTATRSPLQLDALLALEPSGDALMHAAEALRDGAAALTDEQRLAVGRWVLAAADNAFIVPADDVCFHAGTVLQRLGLLDAAAWAYAQALVRYGPHASTHLNLATCLLDLGRIAEAREHLAAALELEPGHPRATALLAATAPAEPKS